jgi:thiol:disulfide interchange protein DsbA
MMRTVRTLLCVLGLLVVASVVWAATPVGGVDYLMLDPAQPSEPGKKVEVIEFFAYYCPHCDALDLPLSNWVKTQGENIVFKRVHTSISGEPVPQQRLYYTLETLGKVEELHRKILYAIHFQKQRLNSDEEIIEFMVKQGMNREKFLDIYHSFSVQSKVNRAIQMQNSYQIHTWPTIVVDGQFVASPPIAGANMETYDEPRAQDLMLNVLDELVSQRHKERNLLDTVSETK